jgi:helix-turn-helix protein
MEVICFQDAAFYGLVEAVVLRMKEKQNAKGIKWISGEEAMAMLRIKSKTTLQELRDEGKIRFSQPKKKMILYDADSINEYLNQNAKDTF